MALVVDCNTVKADDIEVMLSHRKWNDVILLLGKRECPTLKFAPVVLANMPEIQVLQCPLGMDRLAFMMGFLTKSQLAEEIHFFTNAKRELLENLCSDDFVLNIVRDKTEVSQEEEEEEEEEEEDEEEEEEDEEEDEDEEDDEEEEEEDEEEENKQEDGAKKESTKKNSKKKKTSKKKESKTKDSCCSDRADPTFLDESMKSAFDLLLKSQDGQRLIAATLGMATEKKGNE